MKVIKIIFILSVLAVLIFNTSIDIFRNNNGNLEVIGKIAVANSECAKNLGDRILDCTVTKISKTSNTYQWQYNPSDCSSSCNEGGVNCCYDLEIIYSR